MLENILILTHSMACYQNNNKIFFFRLSAKRRRRANDRASLPTSYCYFFISLKASSSSSLYMPIDNIWFIYSLFVYAGELRTCVHWTIRERTSCVNRIFTESDSLTQCWRATYCLSVYWLRSKLNNCCVCVSFVKWIWGCYGCSRHFKGIVYGWLTSVWNVQKRWHKYGCFVPRANTFRSISVHSTSSSSSTTSFFKHLTA